MRWSFLFLVIAFVLIAFILTPRSPLRALVFNQGASAALGGNLLRESLSRFLGVSEEVNTLRAENASLRRELVSNSSPAPTKTFDLKKLIPAEVVFVDRVRPLPLRLVLKVGSANPVASGDLVVSADGEALIGIVERFQDGYIAAKTTMNPGLEVFSLGAESQASGALEGSDISGSFLRVRSSPASADFKEGEAVTSAGVGEIPRGLKIGVVSRAESMAEGAFKITFLTPPFAASLLEPVFILPRSSFPLVP